MREFYNLAAASMHVEFDKKENLAKYTNFIQEAADKSVDLLVFPEASLQGYLRGLEGVGEFNLKPAELQYFYKTAEPIPGPTTKILSQQASKYNMHIVIGMREKVTAGGGMVLYNSSVLIGPRGVIGV